MPTALPGMSVTEAQRILQIAGPHPADLPRGRARLRQGRARRHADRPGAVLDGRDDGRCSSPRRSGARCTRWYSRLAGAGPQAICARIAPDAHHASRSCRTRWTRSCASPASRTSGRCRSRTASTCCRPACARRSASRSSAPTSTVIQQHRRAARGACCATCPGTRSVLAERTAGGYFLDFDLRPRRARALRPLGRRRADDHHVGDRRRERHHHGRGPRALHRQRALRARLPRRPRPACGACSCRPPSGAQIPLAQIADIRLRRGAGDDPQRERPARRLRLRRHERAATSAATSRRPSGASREQLDAADGLHAHLERPVREHGARPRAAEDRRCRSRSS